MARPPTGQVIERDGKCGVTYALRFRAYGQRRYVTLGGKEDGWDRRRADLELENVLADVRRGLWQPPAPAPAVEAPKEEPTFHVLASDWVAGREHEVDARTVEHWRWALSNHLLPVFKSIQPSQITVAAIERYKTAKLRERRRRESESGGSERPGAARPLEQVNQRHTEGPRAGARPCDGARVHGHEPGARQEAPAQGGEAAADVARGRRAPGASRRGRRSPGVDRDDGARRAPGDRGVPAPLAGREPRERPALGHGLEDGCRAADG